MRISNVQNLAVNAANAMNKCCKPRKANENNAAQNNLERSPMQDTVSFEGYEEGKDKASSKEFASLCVRWKFFNAKLLRQETPLEDSIYLKVMPAEDTLFDFKRATCALRLSTPEELRKEESHYASDPDDYYRTMKRHMEDFRKQKGLEKGWEKNLETLEDFQNAVELAEYLDRHPYFGSGSNSDFHREDVNVLNYYDRGLSL